MPVNNYPLWSENEKVFFLKGEYILIKCLLFINWILPVLKLGARCLEFLCKTRNVSLAYSCESPGLSGPKTP